MSRETNKGVMMLFKTITTTLSTIVHLLVEPIISLAKTKVGGPAQFLEKFKNQHKIIKLGIIVDLAV